MTEITLQQYLEKHTQAEAAEILGRTPGAVWQMLRDKRDIRLTLDKKGAPVSWYEIKKPKKRVA